MMIFNLNNDKLLIILLTNVSSLFGEIDEGRKGGRSIMDRKIP